MSDKECRDLIELLRADADRARRRAHSYMLIVQGYEELAQTCEELANDLEMDAVADQKTTEEAA